MDSDPWLGGALLLAIVLLILISVLSALETAILNGRRSRLTMLPKKVAEGVEAVLDAPDQFQTAAHLAKSLAESLFYAAVALSGLQLSLRYYQGEVPDSIGELLAAAWPGLLLGALAGYLAVTIFGEAIPKALALRSPERLLARSLWFLRGFNLLFFPVVWITCRLGRVVAMGAGVDTSVARAAHSEEEIKLLVEGSAEEGVLEEEEKEMIHSIFEFTDTVARQIMVPRIDMNAVSVDTPYRDAMRQVVETGHSRLPVYQGTQDKIVGVIHVKDLISAMVDGRDISLRDVLREPYFVPEGKKIDELLQDFKRQKNRMAIVVDEFGGTSGLVTVEDILEEIVGEIEDEYDVEEHPAAQVEEGDGTTIVDGRMTIEDVNDELGLTIPAEDNDTLGGFVFSLFGRPPHVGERVPYENLEFKIEALDGLRLQKIRITVKEPKEDPEEEQPVA
jgi:putative hemolysin